jgi:hypothetical protein
MLHLDEKYAENLSSYVRNFKKKRVGLYNFSCPICGDSDHDLSKSRGYLYPNSTRTGLIYKCHNCAASLSFYNLLKDQFPLIHGEYILERYTDESVYVEPEPEPEDDTAFHDSSDFMIPLLSLPQSHVARQYVAKRLIPDEAQSRLYYTDDYAKVCQDLFPNRYSNLAKKDSRLLLLFLDGERKIVGLQGRSLNPESKSRYLTARASDNVALVYGRERHRPDKTTYVVEGPIDSLFLPNCLSVASSDLLSAESRMSLTSDVVYVFDNEPRNKEIVNLIESAIIREKKVCIWPNTIVQKDINDMVLAGIDPLKVIQDNTFIGVEAMVIFARWKKYDGRTDSTKPKYRSIRQ